MTANAQLHVHTFVADLHLVVVTLGAKQHNLLLLSAIRHNGELYRHIAHVRICGTVDKPCSRLVLAWGTPSTTHLELIGDGEIILTGEACEWALGEYARDADYLGFKKSLLILGHCGSERDGMKYIAQLMQEKFPQLEIKYFKSEEVYTYSERR
jgi:hypothetical protein